ncbi:MAG: hypothetical protein KA098_03035 [Phenylobacterium sp.]|nr:hypothetical protein [Phenylobacterium sp.]
MFWVWLGLALAVGLICGFWAGCTLIAKGVQPTLEEAARHKASDHDLLMRTFRRELANWMFRTDPDRYMAVYERARLVEAGIFSADVTERRALMNRIAKDIPFIADFDLVGAREYILYSDNLGPYEDVEGHYLDIVRWQALQIAGDPAWKYIAKPTSDADLKYLPEYATKLKDARFKKRLEETMRLYSYARRREDSLSFDNDLFSVRYIYHVAENRYGIHLKDTNEFGIFWTFTDGDRHFEGYYRSSPDFSEDHWLDTHIEE